MHEAEQQAFSGTIRSHDDGEAGILQIEVDSFDQSSSANVQGEVPQLKRQEAYG